MCLRKRERVSEKERACVKERESVCLRKRERVSEREIERESVCMCERECERKRVGGIAVNKSNGVQLDSNQQEQV